MKKLFTLFAVAVVALAVKAQTEPLYTISTKVTNDTTWDAEYDPLFAFQGAEVNVEAYAEDYIIIRNWAGVEGCDLKLEYDPNVDVDADDCYGNIMAVSAIVGGEEQEPYIFTKTLEDEEGTYEVTYCVVSTGRTDFPHCSFSLNEDGSLFWSFIEVDHTSQTGYVELSASFCNEDYTEFMDEQYYFVEWPASEPSGPVFYGTFDAYIETEYEYAAEDQFSGSFPAVEGDIKVDAYSTYAVVHNVAGVEGYDIKVEFDSEETVTAITPIEKGVEGETKTKGYVLINTGLTDPSVKYIQAYVTYGYACCYDDESGYVLLAAYDVNSKYIYYYLVWGDEGGNGTGIKAVQTTADAPIYNLAGQRVGKDYKGIILRDGKKMLMK